MIYMKLYLTFLKIGALAFGGGYATIPLIQRYVVNQNHWIKMNEFIDLISISQMTPGPIAVNAATFVGQKISGVPGSVAATAGVVTPQFILMMVLGYFLFDKNKKFKFLDWMLNGIKAGVVSLIFITVIDLINTSIFSNKFMDIFKMNFSGVHLTALITFFIGLVLYMKKVDIFKLIGTGAVLGIILNILLK